MYLTLGSLRVFQVVSPFQSFPLGRRPAVRPSASNTDRWTTLCRLERKKTMSNSDSKNKQNSDKQAKPSEQKPAIATQKVPERPQPNVTAAQKSAGNQGEKRDNKDDE